MHQHGVRSHDRRDRHTAGTKPTTTDQTHPPPQPPTEPKPTAPQAVQKTIDPASERRASQDDQAQAAAMGRLTGVETKHVALVLWHANTRALSEAGLAFQHEQLIKVRNAGARDTGHPKTA